MQVVTKKPHTDMIELKFTGPAASAEKAIDAMKSVGFKNTSDQIPWRVAYPELSEVQLIGKALAGARHKEGLTQVNLAQATGIPQRHISEMENGKRPIGKEMAKRLGKALNIGYKAFL